MSRRKAIFKDPLSFPKSESDWVYVLVSPRASFARNEWGESYTNNIDDAQLVFGLEDAKEIENKINSRTGKLAVQAELAHIYMKTAWGFWLTEDSIICIQKYFPRHVQVLATIPLDNFRYSGFGVIKSAFDNPRLAWEALRSYQTENLEYHQQRISEIQAHLKACDEALGNEAAENVIPIKQDDPKEN